MISYLPLPPLFPLSISLSLSNSDYTPVIFIFLSCNVGGPQPYVRVCVHIAVNVISALLSVVIRCHLICGFVSPWLAFSFGWQNADRIGRAVCVCVCGSGFEGARSAVVTLP